MQREVVEHIFQTCAAGRSGVLPVLRSDDDVHSVRRPQGTCALSQGVSPGLGTPFGTCAHRHMRPQVHAHAPSANMRPQPGRVCRSRNPPSYGVVVLTGVLGRGLGGCIEQLQNTADVGASFRISGITGMAQNLHLIDVRRDLVRLARAPVSRERVQPEHHALERRTRAARLHRAHALLGCCAFLRTRTSLNILIIF